jgi:flagellar biosynthesis protein FlhG
MEKKDSPLIIPVASGKGGVGKTVISINLAYALASLGKRVVLVDLDFGGANIHTCLGYEHAPDGIGNFLNEKKGLKLADYILTTDNDRLQFIPGDAEMVGIANITAYQKKKLVKELTELDTEYVVLDLGAGSAFNTIDFFMLSSLGIIVATPEITSILNAYAFLKNSIFRLISMGLKKHKSVHDIFEKHLVKGGESAWKVSQLMDKLSEVDPAIHAEAVSLMSSFNPKIIINMALKPKDLAMGERLRKISSSYLNIDMEYLGFLYRDKIVEESIAGRTPLATLKPGNQTFQTIIRIAYKIINAKKFPYYILDIDNYDESLEVLLDEATDDFVARIEGYEELATENLISVTELLSIVKNLEYENLELKQKNEKLETELLRYRKTGAG